MSGTTWTKFYWSDWSNDPALRLCSLAAQGLWMRCLCIAAESQPAGYVAVNGMALTASDLARLVGSSEAEVSVLLSELDQHGVFSRDASGTIYSRRILRDVQRVAVARKNGSKGGNPSLCKSDGNPPSDNPPDKGWVKGRDKTHKPYTKYQNYSARTRSPKEDRASGPALEATVWVSFDSPEGQAWIAHEKLVKGRSPPTDKNGGWWFPSKSPPDPARRSLGLPDSQGAAA